MQLSAKKTASTDRAVLCTGRPQLVSSIRWMWWFWTLWVGEVTSKIVLFYSMSSYVGSFPSSARSTSNSFPCLNIHELEVFEHKFQLHNAETKQNTRHNRKGRYPACKDQLKIMKLVERTMSKQIVRLSWRRVLSTFFPPLHQMVDCDKDECFKPSEHHKIVALLS